MTLRQSVIFQAPLQVETVAEPLPLLAANQVLVHTEVSGISAGTELLFYRGQAPTDLALDATIPALEGDIRYPLRYGYACVGTVAECGPQADRAWLGRRVFAFQPHTSHFAATPADLLPVPDGLGPEQSVLLPSMETAVNFVMDGRPVVGEHVCVVGLGVVGLLTVGLLARFPLASLTAIDPLPFRRALALRLGATAVCAPAEAPPPQRRTSPMK